MKEFPLTDAECGELLIRTRWPEGIACPRCNQGDSIVPIEVGNMSAGLSAYRCRDCRYIFTIITGTVFEKTCLPMGKIAAICLGAELPMKRLAREIGCDRTTIRRLKRLMMESKLAATWRQELRNVIKEKS